MKFLVDAQLPPALARWLGERGGHEVEHVADLGMIGVSDAAIAEHAQAAGAVLVSKDEDFLVLRLPDRSRFSGCAAATQPIARCSHGWSRDGPRSSGCLAKANGSSRSGDRSGIIAPVTVIPRNPHRNPCHRNPRELSEPPGQRAKLC
jgi:hypothetical protein